MNEKQYIGSCSIIPFDLQRVSIPLRDLSWILEQKPRVIRLWLDCWLADTNGIDWVPIDTNLSDSAFRDARKSLTSQGLFSFAYISCQTGMNLNKHNRWMVKNLRCLNNQEI